MCIVWVGMTNEPVERGVPSGPGGHVESIEYEGGGHGASGLPADQAPREHVDDEGLIDDA